MIFSPVFPPWLRRELKDLIKSETVGQMGRNELFEPKFLLKETGDESDLLA